MNAYWTGAYGATWNSTSGSNSNFTTDAAGTMPANAFPNGTSTVIFAASGATNLSNSLGQNFSVLGLQFLAQDASSATIGAVNIADATYNLTIGSGGISDANTGGVTLNPATLIPSASQIWTNSSAAALTISSPVSGTATTGNTTTLTVENTSTGTTNFNGLLGDGSLGGNLGLTVNSSGSGAVVLALANTYSGPTTITSGTLRLGNANSVQNSTVSIGAANGLVFSPSIGTFNLGGLSGSCQ